jgi:transcriptional regulator with XRE-family HTH domain
MINRLRKSRFMSQISQYELALRSGVSQSRISLYENGLIDLSKKEKTKISEALNLKQEELFKREI